MEIPTELPNTFLLLIAKRRQQRDLLSEMITQLALRGEVCVLDAGNLFNAFSIARCVRLRSAQMEQILERIRIARAFTCFQLVALVEQVPIAGTPLFVLELLALFGDEAVPLRRRERLLIQTLRRLKELGELAPVVASLTPAEVSHPDQQRLLARVQCAAQSILTAPPVSLPCAIPLFDTLK